MLIQMFSMQLLNMIFCTKEFDELLFQGKQEIFRQVYESVYSVFIAVVTGTICKILIYFLRICKKVYLL